MESGKMIYCHTDVMRYDPIDEFNEWENVRFCTAGRWYKVLHISDDIYFIKNDLGNIHSFNLNEYLSGECKWFGPCIIPYRHFNVRFRFGVDGKKNFG